jgi:endonuclease G
MDLADPLGEVDVLTERDALYSEVEFDYQYDRYGRLLPVVVYRLEPETFFITSKELDCTLVAVREISLNGIELKRYGWSPLIEVQGKALLGDSLNIVQHPKGEAKQLVLRSNQLVDLFDDFAHYVTDTEPGSSGSPVYNDEWEVVALHHSGVPKMDNGNYIAKDGSVWQQGMDPNDLEWVANEGVRVSSLVGYIKKARFTGEQERLREEMMNSEPPHPLEAVTRAREDVHVPPTSGGDGSFT